MSEWISVEDRLPETEGSYEIKVNGVAMPPEDLELSPCKYHPEHGWMYDWYSTAIYKVTHWREAETDNMKSELTQG